MVKQAFDLEHGLFLETPDRLVYPNPQSQAFIEEKYAKGTAMQVEEGASGSAGGGGSSSGGGGGGGGLGDGAPAGAMGMGDNGGEEEGGEEGEEEVEGGGGMFEGLHQLAMQFGLPGLNLGLPRGPAASARRRGPVPDRSRDHLAHFEFLGRILGKALRCGILVAPRFAFFALLRLLGRPTSVQDLPSLDPELAHGLHELLRLADRVRAARAAAGGAGPAPSASASAPAGGSMGEGAPDEVRALCLTMVVGYVDRKGVVREHALCPRGSDIAVTADNAAHYVALLAHYRLNVQIAEQVRAFLRGFRELVPLPWLRMFQPSELQLLLSGEEVTDVPRLVRDLCANCELHGFGAGDDYILMFWKVLAAFSPADFSLFLSFVTSCPRPPLLGFRTLQPRFGIQLIALEKSAGGGAASGVLPKAATCFNLLKLPFYGAGTEEVLRDKLLTSIREGAGGFYLT